MSFVFGNTFQPHEDSENHGARRVKRENMTARNNAQQGTKRAALGTITNQVRVQPFRAAKQSGVADGNDENAFVKQKTFDASQGFSIYVDSEPKQTTETLKPAFKKVESNKLSLSSAVTALPRQLEAISTASPDVVSLDSSFESPMVLDISHEVLEEKKPLDREAIITHVPEYSEDIYAYLRESELKNRPKPGYMKKQPDITNSMRGILVDWLVEVSEEYKLHRETLFLSINYIDRFLSQMSVQRGKLQLVGAASMFIAAKYEEIYPPDVGEFAYITDDTYTKKQVLRMEHLILKVLSFDVAVPTANWFCEHLLNESNVDEKTKSLAMFLVELTLVEIDPYLKYPPSMIAAAALCLARFSFGMEPWPESIAKTAKYELGHFAECLRDLHKTYCGAAKHPQQAIVEKYKASKHHEVSNFERYSPPDSLPLIG